MQLVCKASLRHVKLVESCVTVEKSIVGGLKKVWGSGTIVFDT